MSSDSRATNGSPALLGEAVRHEVIDLLTGLMRDVRATLGRIERERGRTILLATRVPLRLAQGRYIGTDVETRVKAGLVDFVTLGAGYVPFSMPTAEVAAPVRLTAGEALLQYSGTQ